MVIKRSVILSCVMSALLVALFGAASQAQQTTVTDIWRLAPSNSLLVVTYDGRPDNASVKALTAAQDPQTQELRANQRAAMRKAIESLATLFGITLDLTKDIMPWADQQAALVVLSDEKGDVQPVFVIASKDAAAASAALQKIASPWQRIGELAPEQESGCPIMSFRMQKPSIEVYASACGPLVAFSPSKTLLLQALKGGGFAPGSPADKVFTTLSGSLLCAYADPALLKMVGVKPDAFPVNGLGLGVSAIDTGIKLRAVGVLSDKGAEFLKQVLSTQQTGALTANAGIPSASLAAASLPSLNGLAAMAQAMKMPKNPMLETAKAVSDTQISAALTAVLPTWAAVASAMAESDQAAADKLGQIVAGLKALKMKTAPTQAAGLQATAIGMPGNRTFLLAQSGKHILLASDALSLAGAAATIKGEQPGITQSATYKETIAGLGDSNLLTAYVNLSPVQGLGFLLEGLGVGHMAPLYGALAKGLENMQALGLGAGFDGQVASATMFLRAKPGLGAGAAIAGAGITAAVVFPMFARARQSAREAACMSNLKQLATATLMYASDHDGKLPTSAQWRAQLKPYVKRPIDDLRCPSGNAVYAFNKNLGGVSQSKIKTPAKVVMLFEANPGLPNASGSKADAIFPHHGQGTFAFADGHVARTSQLPGQSQWAPYTAPAPVKKAPVKKAPVGGKRPR